MSQPFDNRDADVTEIQRLEDEIKRLQKSIEWWEETARIKTSEITRLQALLERK